MRMRSWCGALVLLSVLPLGCKKQGSSQQEHMDGEKAKARAELLAPERRGPAFSLAPEPVTAKPPASGPAYFAIEKVGLVTFGVDGAITLDRLPLGIVAGLGVDADGAAIVASDGVVRVKNGKVEIIGGEASPSSSPGAVVRTTPDGRIWIGEASGFHEWDGSTWTKHPRPFGKDLFRTFQIDGKGRVYALGYGSVIVYDGKWQTMYDWSAISDQGVYGRPKVADLVLDGKEVILIQQSRENLQLDGASVSFVERESTGTQGNGRKLGSDYISIRGNEALRAPLRGGAPDQTVKFKDEYLNADLSYVDDGGRVWVRDERGVHVVAPDGAVTSWPAGSVPDITGDVKAIHVVGTGPDKLPATGGAVAKGSLRGRVMKKDTPLVAAVVEVCPSPSMSFVKGTTPCTGSSPSGNATADADGNFVIADMPLRAYGVAIKADNDWYKILGSQCAGMSEGDTCDLGTLDITKPAF